MAEYINREAIHRMMGRLTRYKWTSPVSVESHVTVDADDVNFGLDRIPAADVAPVRHGRWIKYAGKLICSECKTYPPMKDDSGGWRIENEWPFSSNCGAKIEGEK